MIYRYTYIKNVNHMNMHWMFAQNPEEWVALNKMAVKCRKCVKIQTFMSIRELQMFRTVIMWWKSSFLALSSLCCTFPPHNLFLFVHIPIFFLTPLLSIFVIWEGCTKISVYCGLSVSNGGCVTDIVYESWDAYWSKF